MTGPHGRVVALTAHRALIEVNPGFRCSRCAAGRGCGAALLSAGRHRRAVLLAVQRRPNLRLDQPVSLSLAASAMSRMGARAYGIALVALLLGFAVGAWLGLGDGWTALCGIAGLAGGLAVGRSLSRGDPIGDLAQQSCIAAPDVPNQA